MYLDVQNAAIRNAAERLDEEKNLEQEPEQIQQQNVPEPPVPHLVLTAGGNGDCNIEQATLEEDNANDVFENFTAEVAVTRNPNVPSSSSLARRNIDRLAENYGLPQKDIENQAKFSSGALQVSEADLQAAVVTPDQNSSALPQQQHQNRFSLWVPRVTSASPSTLKNTPKKGPRT
jgi:hypothetical protein